MEMEKDLSDLAKAKVELKEGKLVGSVEVDMDHVIDKLSPFIKKVVPGESFDQAAVDLLKKLVKEA